MIDMAIFHNCNRPALSFISRGHLSIQDSHIKYTIGLRAPRIPVWSRGASQPTGSEGSGYQTALVGKAALTTCLVSSCLGSGPGK